MTRTTVSHVATVFNPQGDRCHISTLLNTGEKTSRIALRHVSDREEKLHAKIHPNMRDANIYLGDNDFPQLDISGIVLR